MDRKNLRFADGNPSSVLICCNANGRFFVLYNVRVVIASRSNTKRILSDVLTVESSVFPLVNRI